MRHFYLSDRQWEAIKPHLPPDRGRNRRVDDRHEKRYKNQNVAEDYRAELGGRPHEK